MGAHRIQRHKEVRFDPVQGEMLEGTVELILHGTADCGEWMRRDGFILSRLVQYVVGDSEIGRFQPDDGRSGTGRRDIGKHRARPAFAGKSDDGSQHELLRPPAPGNVC